MLYSFNNKLDFGRYKGFTIYEVVTGWKNPNQEFLLAFIKERIPRIEDYTFYQNHRTFNLKILRYDILINNRIILDFQVSIDYQPENIEQFINIAFEIDESYPGRLLNSINDFILRQRLEGKYEFKVFADPEYILWCIKNVAYFAIPLEELQLLHSIELCFFEGITFKKQTGTVFNFDIHLVNRKGVISEEILQINANKITRPISDFDDGNNDDKYEDYGGAYGYDDDTIDDAFDGDPHNYWNID